MNLLAGLTVLDLTQRLPGPMGGYLLATLGAQVIKVEDVNFQDPFIQLEADKGLANFQDWYRELNQNKKLVRFDFFSSNARQEAARLIDQADIILLGMPAKVKESLGLKKEQLQAINKPIAIIEIGASQTHMSSMHDLNALAEAGFLHLHVAHETHSPLAPPFLPVAGISFGQQIALTALALHRQAQLQQKPLISEIFLFDEIKKVMNPLWSERLRQQNETKFLHNGAFPCYALYRNKDGDWLAVAAVEEKFWLEFVKIFNLPLTVEDRFSKDPKTFQHVVQAIHARSTAELEGLLASKEICVSLIKTTR